MSFSEEKSFIGWIIVVFILLGLFAGIVHWVSKPTRLLDRVTEPGHIINNYEDYQTLYDDCRSLCKKIDNLSKLTSETSGGFSKEERLLALQNRMEELIAEYNAKSKMITRKMWKSSSLPHSLDSKTICNN